MNVHQPDGDIAAGITEDGQSCALDDVDFSRRRIAMGALGNMINSTRCRMAAAPAAATWRRVAQTPITGSSQDGGSPAVS